MVPLAQSTEKQCELYGTRQSGGMLSQALEYSDAKVAELADAPDLGSGGRKAMGVQVPPFAPISHVVVHGQRIELKRNIHQ